jgi:PAS domain S-box-containing protein
MVDQRGGGVRVLHVDDAPEFVDLVAEHLQRASERIEFESETSPEAALETIRTTPPDCVVSDYEMPDMDGLELLRAVREDHPDLPFVLFTGKGSEEIASEAISAGVTDYIQKGGGAEKFELLANRIENAVEAHRMEAAFDQEHEKLTALFENSPDAVVEYRLEGDEAHVESVNAGFVETFGVEAATVVGERLDDRIVPEVRRDRARALNRRAEAEGPFRQEVRREAADGVRDFLLTSIPLETAPGGYAVYTEVSEARERERRLETLVRNLPGIVYRCANEPSWPMTFVGGDCEALTGYPAAAVEAGEVEWGEDVVAEGENDALWEAVQEAVEAREPFTLGYDIRTASGERRRVWEKGRRVCGNDDELEALEGFITDVTSHHRMAEALQELSTVLETPALEAEEKLTRVVGLVDSVEVEPLYDLEGRSNDDR